MKNSSKKTLTKFEHIYLNQKTFLGYQHGFNMVFIKGKNSVQSLGRKQPIDNDANLCVILSVFMDTCILQAITALFLDTCLL